MSDIKVEKDEVILFNESVFHDGFNLDLDLTLTNKRINFSGIRVTKTGFLKLTKVEEPINEDIKLEDIKIYNNDPQLTQKNDSVFIQTINKNFTITFDNFLKARQFITKVIDILTESKMLDRGLEKTNKTINKIDNVLGVNTRNTIKGVIENGLVGSIFKGIKGKKNKK
jgi:hypothetical protein